MMNSTSAYRLRGFEADNPCDIERMNLMYYHPQVMKAKGYFKRGFNFADEADLQETHKSMFDTLTIITENHEDVSYAVADNTNKLVGWIWCYRDNRHPLPVGVMKKRGLRPEDCRSYQVSYEKLMSEGWPEEVLTKMVHTTAEHLSMPRKGVIVEGLRLAIEKMTAEYRKLFAEDNKLILYGYVNPRNIASKKVLEYNGFVKETRKYRYEHVWHDLWVKII